MRLRAFLTHLSGSALAALGLTAAFMFFLFPMPYFLADGGWQGLRIVVPVDIVIGPLLTFIVFRPGKSRPKLVFDMTVIILLQLSAFSWGLWNIYSVRPDSVMFVDGAFITLSADMAKNYPEAYGKLAKNAPGKPFYAVVDLPDGRDERQKLRIEALRTQAPLYLRFDLMKPLGEEVRQELEISIPKLAKLVEPETKTMLEKWAKGKGLGTDDYYFVKTVCRYQNVLLAIKRSDLTVEDYFTSLKIKD